MHNDQIIDLAISVIIPVYNDQCGLMDTLDSLVNQDFPKENFEIIISDNGSSDNTLNTAEMYAKRYPELIHIVVENNIKSSYAARNKGINASKGSIIAFIDSDMSVDKDWLTKIANSFEKNRVDYLACRVEIYLKIKSAYELYNKITGFPLESCINDNHFAPTCCLIVRKNVFNEVGLFDSRLVSSGDYEFGNRVFNSGYKLYYDDSIVMRHPARSTFKQIFCKFFRIGKGYKQLSYYYPKRYKELDRNIMNLRYYLPSKPWSYSIKMKENKNYHKLPILTKIELYLIEWEVKLAKQLGYAYEKFKKN